MIEIRQGNQLGEAGFPFSVFVALISQCTDIYRFGNVCLGKAAFCPELQ